MVLNIVWVQKMAPNVCTKTQLRQVSRNKTNANNAACQNPYAAFFIFGDEVVIRRHWSRCNNLFCCLRLRFVQLRAVSRCCIVFACQRRFILRLLRFMCRDSGVAPFRNKQSMQLGRKRPCARRRTFSVITCTKSTQAVATGHKLYTFLVKVPFFRQKVTI